VSGWVRSGQVRSGQVTSGQVRLVHMEVKPGPQLVSTKERSARQPPADSAGDHMEAGQVRSGQVGFNGLPLLHKVVLAGQK
jgi:hypothetical protein